MAPKVKAVCIDAILDAESGLRWYCPDCKKFSSANLLAKLRKFKKTFLSIYDSLTDVNNLFLSHKTDYEELCDHVEISMNLPKPMVISKRHSSNKRRSKSSSLYNDGTRRAIKPTFSSLFDTDIDDSLSHDVPTPSMLKGVTPAISKTSPDRSGNITLKPPSPMLTTLTVPTKISSIDSSLSFSSALEDEVIPSLGHTAGIPGYNNMDGGGILRVILPPKVIFISRLQYGTKVEDIIKFIGSGGVETELLKCYCLTPDGLSDRMMSSFKLIVPDGLFNKLMDKNFWPKKILIKEFKPRPRNSTASKNVTNSRSFTKTLEV